MNYFFLSLRMSLAGWLRSRTAKVFAVLAALLTVPAVLLSGVGGTEPIRVGVVLPEQGGEALVQLLQQSDGPLRYEVSDAASARRNVLAGNWDCALILAEDFDKRIAALDVDGIITMQLSAGSTVYPLVRESVCACMMELMAPYIAGEYLEDVGVKSGGMELHPAASQVQVQLQTLDGKPLLLPESGAGETQRLLRCCAALLSLLWGLYLAVDLGKWREGSGARRLESVRASWLVLLPRQWGAMLPVFAWGLIMMVLLDGGFPSVGGYICFMAAVMGISLFVSLHRPLWQAVPALMPFLLPVTLLLEPVLLDTAALFPALAPYICWLPMTLFIRTAEGCPGAALGLLAESAVLTGLSLLSGKSRR